MSKAIQRGGLIWRLKLASPERYVELEKKAIDKKIANTIVRRVNQEMCELPGVSICCIRQRSESIFPVIRKRRNDGHAY